MADIFMDIPTSIEPLKTNRWLIVLDDTIQKIPPYIFTDFKLESELIEDKGVQKHGLKLELNSINTTQFLLTPDDILNTKKIRIEFLDPTGVKLNHYEMDVELDKFSLVGDYGNGDILSHKVSFWVKKLDQLHLNGDVMKETLENYKKNKK